MNLRKFSFVLAVLMIFGLAVYGIYWNVQATKRAEGDTVAYSRAFGELLENLDDAENYLLKAMASGSAENTSLMLEEVRRSATLAESHLEILPISQQVMADVSKYLVQLADVAKYLNGRTVYGDSVSAEDAELLTKMYGYAQDINGAFQYMACSVTGGNCTWKEIEEYSGVILENEEIEEGYDFLSNFSEPMEDYPTLIYDGPFSEHMMNTEPRGLSGDIITKEQAAERLKNMLPGYDVKESKFLHENEGVKIKTYSYEITIKSNTGGKDLTGYADVTAQGGKLYSFMLYREVGEVYLAEDQAVEQGLEYLSALGFENMEASYYNMEAGVLTANYCSTQDNVFCYPDMVKVSIAMDTGELLGIEAERYFMNHTLRNIGDASVSEESARSLISEKLTVEAVKKCIIPNDFGGEYLTYEFSCMLDGRNCLVYIDCNSGREREILIIQESDSGILVK